MATKTQTPQPCKNIEFQLNANTFVRTGYVFKGWNTDWNATTVQYDDMVRVTFSDDTDLYAIWSPSVYTVHRNNGYGGTLSDISATFDNSFIVDALSRSGYKFRGWYVTSGLNPPTAKYGDSLSSCNTSISSSSTLCANGNPSGQVSFKNLTTTSNGQVTITGQWTANTYSVRFNANGGTGTMQQQSFTYDIAHNLTPNSFTKTGYNFHGWATSANGSVEYSDGESVNNLSSIQGSIVTLYAKWQANTYTIRFNANGGSGDMSSMTMTYDATATLPTNTFAKPYHEFMGWATSADGTVAYNNETSVINLSDTQDATIDLYAVWQYSNRDEEVNNVSDIHISGTRGTVTNSPDPTQAFPWVGHIGRNFTASQGSTTYTYWDIRYMECPPIVGRGSQGGYFTEESFMTKGGFVDYGSGYVQDEKVDKPKQGSHRHGTGGMCLKTIDLSNLQTKKLVSKVKIFPGISCYEDTKEDTTQIEGIPENTGDFSNNYGPAWNTGQHYSNLINGTQQLYWDEQSQKHECFPIGMPSTDGYGAYKYGGFIYGRGQWFGITMIIQKPNNTTQTISLSQQDLSSNSDVGWVSATEDETYHSIIFDVGESLLNLPNGSYTKEITFHQGTSETSMTYNMALHGVKLYGHDVQS